MVCRVQKRTGRAWPLLRILEHFHPPGQARRQTARPLACFIKVAVNSIGRTLASAFDNGQSRFAASAIGQDLASSRPENPQSATPKQPAARAAQRNRPSHHEVRQRRSSPARQPGRANGQQGMNWEKPTRDKPAFPPTGSFFRFRFSRNRTILQKPRQFSISRGAGSLRIPLNAWLLTQETNTKRAETRPDEAAWPSEGYPLLGIVGTETRPHTELKFSSQTEQATSAFPRALHASLNFLHVLLPG